MVHKQSGGATRMTGGGAALRRRQRLMDRNGQGCRIWKGGQCSVYVNPTSSADVSYLRSNRRRPPRGQRCRRSGPVGPASLHLHRSTVWEFLSLRRSPHTSLSPPRGNPCEEPCQGRLRGSSPSVGSACRTPARERSKDAIRVGHMLPN